MPTPRTIHGIDLTAPGGLEALFAFRRAQFGDAVMELGAGETAGEGGDGNGPAPEAPQTPPAATPQEPAAPNASEAPEGDGEETPKESPAELEARIRREAAADAEKAVAERIGKALGFGPEEGEKAPTVEELTRQLEAQTQEKRAAQLEVAVYRGAEAVGANPVAVADSRSLLAKLADVDPADDRAVQAAIREAMTTNPALRRASTRSGGDATGGDPQKSRPTDLASAIRAELGD